MENGQQVPNKRRAIGNVLFFWCGMLIAAEFLVAQPPSRTTRGPFLQYIGRLALLPGDAVARLLGSRFVVPLTDWTYWLIVLMGSFAFWVAVTTYVLYRRNWRW